MIPLRRHPSPILSIVVLLLVAGPATPARAQPFGGASAGSSADRIAALSLAREGRCHAALELLAPLVEARPGDPELARLRGECALRLQDFPLAIASLEHARAIDPDTPDVDLHLAMAYYHAGRIDEASAALERAAVYDPDRAELLLYSGLVAFAREDHPAAVRRLDAASQLSEAPVEPMASFFLGRAALGTEETDRARDAFARVVEEFPGTPWAEEAQRAIDEIDGGGGLAWWARVEVGFEHDDNPLLRGVGVGLPSEIAGQSDQRAFWFVDVGAPLFDLAGFETGAMLRYGGSEHFELERFDTHAPGATVWVDRDLGVASLSARLQYDFDVAWIDADSIESDPFVISHLAALSLYRSWQGGAYTIFTASAGVDDYRYARPDFGGDPDGATPPGPGQPCTDPTLTFCGPDRNEADATDRDGTGVSAGLLHHEPLPIELPGIDAPWIEGGYTYQRYWSEGSEYDHQRHQIRIGVGALLPFEIGLRVSGRYAYAPYGNPSVFPDPSDVAAATEPAGGGREYFLDPGERREHLTGVRVSLERAIGEHVVLTTRYSRTRNRSTADVFSYTRDLFGISLRVALGG